MIARMFIGCIVLTFLLPTGPASSSEATPKALVRFEELGVGLREAVGDHQRLQMVEVPSPTGELLTLELERFSVLTPETRIVLGHEEVLDVPDIALLRGHVVGEPESRVVMSVSSGDCYAIIQRPGDESLVIVPAGELDPSSGKRRLEIQSFRDAGSIGDINIDPATGVEIPYCLVGPEMVPRPTPFEMKEEQKRATPRVCRVALECDYEFWDYFQDLEDALANIYVVMGQISVMFERDVDVKIVMPFIRIWSIVGDPYSYIGGDSTGLNELRDYWMVNHNPGQPGFVERDLTHLRSGRGVGAYAWVGVLCDYSQGYSISGGQGYATDATGILHDVSYAGHELGHNLGGIHTHCFDPPVDQCATDPGCNQTQDCSTAPGTIMSYCHNCPGGQSNILAMVAPENVTLMLAEVASSCIPYGRNPCYVDLANTGAEDGTVAYPYDTVEEGGYFVQPAGLVIIEAGSYAEIVDLWQAMTLQAVNGNVVIGQ